MSKRLKYDNLGNMEKTNIIDRQFRLARIWSNDQLKKIAHLFTGKVVNVSAGEDIDKQGAVYRNYFINAASYHITNYDPGSYRGYQSLPGEILLDLTTTVPENLAGSFDIVFSHTTLEHVFDVKTAFKNICLLSTDIVIVVVPFSQVQHENSGYMDYWRFTPSCLRNLYEQNCLQVIYEAVSSDRNAAIYLFFVGSRCPEMWLGIMPAHKPIKCAGEQIGKEAPYTMRPDNSLALKKFNSGSDQIEETPTIIVRSAGERTTKACIYVLQQAMPDAEIVCINEVPFSLAVRRCYEIGIEKGRKWTLVIDADVLIRAGYIPEILSLAETLHDDVFVVKGLIFDKFLHVLRPAGNHLYRTSHLKRAIDQIPKEGETLRPEHETTLRMTDLGFSTVQTSIIAGLHDFEQNYLDIAKKCFLQAHKHDYLMNMVLPVWERLAKNDEDFRVALHGAEAGKSFDDQMYIDTDFLEKKVISRLKKKLPIKDPLPANAYDNEQILKTLHGKLFLRDTLILQPKVFNPRVWNTIMAGSRTETLPNELTDWFNKEIVMPLCMSRPSSSANKVIYELLDNDVEQVMVYGAGDIGAELYEMMLEAQINILLYMESNPDPGKPAPNGKSPLAPENAIELYPGVDVVIASRAFVNPMLQRLIDVGLDGRKVWVV